MNLYRVHYAWRNGGVSSSEIDYYETEDKLKVDLLNHYLDMQYHSKNWLTMMLANAWRRARKIDDWDRRTTTRIIKVEKIENDEWVPVEVTYYEPSVHLGGDRIGSERKE